jgi:hypothetical protein
MKVMVLKTASESGEPLGAIMRESLREEGDLDGDCISFVELDSHSIDFSH